MEFGEDSRKVTNWERLGAVGRLLIVIVLAVLVGPAAAGVWRSGRGEGRVLDGGAVLLMGMLAGPVLMAGAGAVFATRRAWWGVWLAVGVGLLHLGIVAGGGFVAALFSGMIAPCHGSDHLEPGFATVWVVGSTVPLAVMMCLATESWLSGPAMLVAAFAGGRCVESADAAGPAWGVLAWDAGAMLPLAWWMVRSSVAGGESPRRP